MKILLDLTRATPDTEMDHFATVFRAYPELLGGELVVFRMKTQWQPPLGDHVVLPDNLSYNLVAATVFDRLQGFLRANTTERIDVISFHKAVFDLRHRLTAEQAATVHFRSFRSVSIEAHARKDQPISKEASAQPLSLQPTPPQRESDTPQQRIDQPLQQDAVASRTSRPSKTRTPSDPVIRWPSEVMPLPDAIDALTSALSEAGAITRNRALRQTDLRTWLVRSDPRFEKSNPHASAPGLISSLVHASEDRGDVWVDRQDLASPRLWLRSQTRNTSARATRPDRQATQRSSRSQQFLDTLRDARLGPFSRIRQSLYDALETHVSDGPVTLVELLKRAVDTTRAATSTAEAEAERYPWRGVREFLSQLLIRRPVLLAEDGSLLTVSFGTLSSRVTGLAPDWRLDLDGELIVALVVAPSLDIRLGDLQALAGALYFDRSDESEARLAAVVMRCLNTGRLVESGQVSHRLSLPLVK